LTQAGRQTAARVIPEPDVQRSVYGGSGIMCAGFEGWKRSWSEKRPLFQIPVFHRVTFLIRGFPNDQTEREPQLTGSMQTPKIRARSTLRLADGAACATRAYAVVVF